MLLTSILPPFGVLVLLLITTQLRSGSSQWFCSLQWNICSLLHTLMHSLILGSRLPLWWEHVPATIVTWAWFLDLASCGPLSLLLIFCSTVRGFSPGASVFLSPQTSTLPNSNLIWIQWTRNATLWMSIAKTQPNPILITNTRFLQNSNSNWKNGTNVSCDGSRCNMSANEQLNSGVTRAWENDPVKWSASSTSKGLVWRWTPP